MKFSIDSVISLYGHLILSLIISQKGTRRVMHEWNRIGTYRMKIRDRWLIEDSVIVFISTYIYFSVSGNNINQTRRIFLDIVCIITFSCNSCSAAHLSIMTMQKLFKPVSTMRRWNIEEERSNIERPVYYCIEEKRHIDNQCFSLNNTFTSMNSVLRNEYICRDLRDIHKQLSWNPSNLSGRNRFSPRLAQYHYHFIQVRFHLHHSEAHAIQAPSLKKGRLDDTSL